MQLISFFYVFNKIANMKLYSTLLFTSLFTFFVLATKAQETRPIKNFHTVANAGASIVSISMGEQEGLKIEGAAEDVERIETVVQNGVLKIRTKRDINNWNVALGDVKIHIMAKSLDALMQSGSGSITLNGTLNSPKANIQLSGSGKVVAAVESQATDASLSGSGNIVLSGKTGLLNLVMAGSGDINAEQLDAENSKIKIAGNGTAYVQVSESIDAKMLGPGAVKYNGNPEIKTSKLGQGTVSPM